MASRAFPATGLGERLGEQGPTPCTAPVGVPCGFAYAARGLWRRAYIGWTIVTSDGGGVNAVYGFAVIDVGVRDVGRRGTWRLASLQAV